MVFNHRHSFNSNRNTRFVLETFYKVPMVSFMLNVMKCLEMFSITAKHQMKMSLYFVIFIFVYDFIFVFVSCVVFTSHNL